MKKSTIILLMLFFAVLAGIGYFVYEKDVLNKQEDELYSLVREHRGEMNYLEDHKERSSSVNDNEFYFSYETDFMFYKTVEGVKEGGYYANQEAADGLALATIDLIKKEDKEFYKNLFAYALSVENGDGDSSFSLEIFWFKHAYYLKAHNVEFEHYSYEEDNLSEEEIKEEVTPLLAKYFIANYINSFRNPKKLSNFFDQNSSMFYSYVSKDFYKKVFKKQVDELLDAYHKTKGISDKDAYFQQLIEQKSFEENYWDQLFWYRRHLEGNTSAVFRVFDEVDIHYSNIKQ